MLNRHSDKYPKYKWTWQNERFNDSLFCQLTCRTETYNYGVRVFSVGNSGCCWHVGGARIAAAYKAFSSEKFKGDLGVYIGLDHVNITLDAVPQWEDVVGKSNNQSKIVFIDVHYNERCACGYRCEISFC